MNTVILFMLILHRLVKAISCSRWNKPKSNLAQELILVRPRHCTIDRFENKSIARYGKNAVILANLHLILDDIVGVHLPFSLL